MKGNISRIIDNSYGFIETDSSSYNNGFFFHKSNFENCDIYDVQEGDCVEFELVPGRDGREQAIHIRKLYKSIDALAYANPGINPSARFAHFSDDEQAIIKCLSKVFYVTNGGDEFNLNKSKYKYCLIKPTEEFVHLFNLNREIVVIFSDYLNFEPRTLDAASVVYNRIESQLRLDRGCHVLISHDRNVENGLNSILKDSNVSQIVIPYSYDEFNKMGLLNG